MGCCGSREDQPEAILTHHTDAISGGEPSRRSEGLPTVPEPQRSSRGVPSTDVDPFQLSLWRTSSQRGAETRNNNNPRTFPSPMTPNTLNKESVKQELDELLDLGRKFVNQYFSPSSKSQSSKARKTIYQSVIENVVGKDNPKSHEQIADEVENRWKILDFPSPSRKRTDLLEICEKTERIGEKMNRDEGTWVFTWESESGEELEFPNATRDRESVYQGFPCDVDNDHSTDNEEE